VSSFLPLSERNLILTGYIGPDTPLLGEQIAAQLRKPYVNVERIIADRVELPVDEIRAYFGETRLKAIEAEIIGETVLRRSHVIRISGRTLVHSDHLAQLRATGPVICLVAQLDAILQRLHINMGALYHDPAERALALGSLKREWAVRGMAGTTELDVTHFDAETLIETVIDTWQAQAIERI